MSYWPAFEVPSWNALAKNESYGSVRNSTFVPVAASNIGRIVPLNGVSAPSSNAPMTSLPPAWAVLGLAAAMDRGRAARLEEAGPGRIDADPNGRADRRRPASIGSDSDATVSNKHL